MKKLILFAVLFTVISFAQLTSKTYKDGEQVLKGFAGLPKKILKIQTRYFNFTRLDGN
jgi:hypothetical protein